MTKVERNRPWGIHTIHDLIGRAGTQASDDGVQWRRAVPEPYEGNFRERLVCAWWVLTGRAHAVRWPHIGEFEAAAGFLYPKDGGKPVAPETI